MFKIRAIQEADLSAIAEIHLRAFPDSALTQLGLETARRYYLWQLTGPHDADFFGVFEGSRLLGSCVAGIFRGALSGFLKQNRGYLLLQLMRRPYCIRKPSIRKTIGTAAKAFFRIRATRKMAPGRGSQKSFGILAIAVDPLLQGKGLGRLLMRECERIARTKGYQKMHLTVHSSNAQATAFYERLGWQRSLEADNGLLSMQKRLG